MKSEHPTPVITPVTQHQVDRARQGELALQQCSTDSTIWYPPSTHCPTCLGADFTWATASGRATLWSWVRIHQPYLKAFRDEVPYLVAYVQLEEGPTLITTLVDTDDHELTIDQPLELTFDAYGADEIPMPVFRPAPGF